MGKRTSVPSQVELEAHVLAETFWSIEMADGSGKPDPRLAEACIALHNDGSFDFLHATEQLALRDLTSWRRWQAFELICAVMPQLHADVEVMLDVLARLMALSGDGNSYELSMAFEKWCGAQDARSIKVIELAEQGHELATANLGLALRALGRPDEALRIATVYLDSRRFEALGALARLAHPDAESRTKTSSFLKKLLRAGAADDKLHAAVVRILTDAIAQVDHPLDAPNFAILDEALSNGGEATLHQAALTFMVGTPTLLSPEVLRLLLSQFERVAESNRGTVERIDAGLKHMFERGDTAQALEFITLMAGRETDPFPLSAFNSALRSIALGTGQKLQLAMLNWLKVGQPQICSQLSDLAQEFQIGESPWLIDLSQEGFSSIEILFICRRAIGYFLIAELVPASLIVCAFRTAEPDLAHAMVPLLVDPLLMNYRGKLRRYLETITPDDPAHAYIAEALRQVDAYRQGLGSEMAAEFAVPAERQQLAHYLRSDEMRAATKAARKKSVLADLVTNQYILYGNRTSSWIKQRDGSRRWIDNEMTSYGYSYEIPRQDVLDPVGFQHQLFDLRFRKLRK